MINTLTNKLSAFQNRSKYQLLLVAISTVIASILTLFATKFIVISLKPEDVSSFLLVKRLTPLLSIFLLFGTPVSLPIFLSKYPAIVRPLLSYVAKRSLYGWIILTMFFILLPKQISYLTGQHKTDFVLNMALLFQVFVFSFYTVYIKFFSGIQKFFRVSLLQFFALGLSALVGSLFVLIFPSLKASGAIIVSNILMLGVLILLNLGIGRIIKNIENKHADSKDEFDKKEFKIFSLKRLFADLWMNLFLVLPGILVTNIVSPKIGVIFNFCFILNNIIILILNPITTVFLPKFSAKTQKMNKTEIYNSVKKVCFYSFIFALISILIISVSRNIIVSLFLSDDYLAYSKLLAFASFSCGGLVLYNLSRLLIDSIYRSPLHIYPIIASTIIFVAFFFIIPKNRPEYYFLLLSISYMALGVGSSLIILIKSFLDCKKEQLSDENISWA
ncbi:MAG: hypothetical protein PHC34_02715 [Candidatus Gastranaerophilales bacterium]|nr:hypothetical protein [Candidatus Gastranaerophilales bacterium]